MSLNWWKRIFSRPTTALAVEDEPVRLEESPDDDARYERPADTHDSARHERPAHADESVPPAEPVADDAPPEEFELVPEVDPRQPTPSIVIAPIVANSASLGRSMAWRVRVLLDGATDESRRSDGPALVEMLLEGGESFISQPPAAALRALEVTRNPNSSIAQIVTLFESDPMLTQALLKMANSAYYRLSDEPVVAIGDGVRRVGMQVVQSVLMASMVEAMLCRPGGPFDAMVRKAWSHMQRTAPLARAIAPAFGVHPDSAYAYALLHDVGKLVIFDHVSTLRREKRRDLRIPTDFFRQVLLHLHEPVGGLAMLRWGMGGEAAHVVGEHHRRPVPETPDPYTEVVFVAEALELAQTNHTAIDWQELWSRGGLTADPVEVEERMGRAVD